MGLFGSSQVARDAEARRAVLSPAPGQVTPLGTPNPPGTAIARSTATVAALTAAKRQRKKATQAPGTGATPSGRPLGVLSASYVPRSLIGF